MHIFREVTEQLNVGCLDSDFSGMGQHLYRPMMLLRLLMWGMANRVVSTRRIEVLARRDVSFIYLAGGDKPDYCTLARFRRRNAVVIKDSSRRLVLKELFKETVLLCARLGMVNPGQFALLTDKSPCARVLINKAVWQKMINNKASHSSWFYFSYTYPGRRGRLGGFSMRYEHP